MNELLQAAKAALDCWHRHWPIESRMKRLAAAVERAESRQHVRLSDEEIQECFDIAQKNFTKHQTGIKGQQLTIRDWPNWHFAKAIEQTIMERNQ